MNDPHVASLTYRVVETDSLEFEDPPDLRVSTPEFEVHLSDGILTLEPKHHFAVEADAKPVANALFELGRSMLGYRSGDSLTSSCSSRGLNWLI